MLWASTMGSVKWTIFPTAWNCPVLESWKATKKKAWPKQRHVTCISKFTIWYLHSIQYWQMDANGNPFVVIKCYQYHYIQLRCTTVSLIFRNNYLKLDFFPQKNQLKAGSSFQVQVIERRKGVRMNWIQDILPDVLLKSWPGIWRSSIYRTWVVCCSLNLFTPPKFNMEPENDGFQKESPFPGTSFQVRCNNINCM